MVRRGRRLGDPDDEELGSFGDGVQTGRGGVSLADEKGFGSRRTPGKNECVFYMGHKIHHGIKC